MTLPLFTLWNRPHTADADSIPGGSAAVYDNDQVTGMYLVGEGLSSLPSRVEGEVSSDLAEDGHRVGEPLPGRP